MKTEEVISKISDSKSIAGIKGFIVDIDLPSTSCLEISLKRIFKGTPIGYVRIKLFTKYFYNRLKVISRHVYSKLKAFAIKTSLGYFISVEDIPRLQKLREETEKELKEFQQELELFVRHGTIPKHCEEWAKRRGIWEEYRREVEEYRKVVTEYLLERGINISEIPIPDLVERFRVKVIPLPPSWEVIEEAIEPEKRDIVKKMINETIRLIHDEVRRQLEVRKSVDRQSNRRA